ncbi:hypothetical protein M0220_14125 [Halomonas qinghailakensis]|uniref:Uncharacterized protein n=1 Tax=Halomonas qinghailakensis TaxID=2937790 RepID=A0AA46YQ04_9GAMM|nr:hypothetical protein [Halomonas sp. ZZQ-149]UYO74000.1 hypothetical protein M0220_14125 [Halomonas sp. ZZQ-149]
MLIATLGPAGSNHELVANRYLNRHAPQGNILLYTAFEDAFKALLEHKVDRVLQCTAHPEHGHYVGRYMHRVFPVDAFIAGSKPLAILARVDVKTPKTLALQPATRFYTDLSGYSEIIEEPSIVNVSEGLLNGEYDAGICAQEVQAQHPQQLRTVKELGSALDTWVMFGRTPLSNTNSRVY